MQSQIILATQLKIVSRLRDSTDVYKSTVKHTYLILLRA